MVERRLPQDMSLIDRVLRTVRKHQMFPRGARVVVALSGGPDSVALVHVLRVLEGRGELTVAGVAHFNHQLRGAGSDADEQFCRQFAERLGLPCDLGRADVAALARESKRSIEDTARSVRYAFLGDAADRLNAGAIAVGHSLDDQAETFLLRMMRGAGTRGLGGIRPRSGRIVRPLLEISRRELRAYAAEHSLAYCVDESNEDVTIPRNRVRHQVLPLLESISPSIATLLAQQAELARQDEEYLEEAAIDLADSIVLKTERGTEMDAAALASLPPALSSRLVRKALMVNAPGQFVGFEHIQRVLALAAGGDADSSAAFPGQIVARRGARIVLGPPPGAPFTNFFRFSLSIPGEVALAEWTISAQQADGQQAEMPLCARSHEVCVASAPLRWPLAVRTRRPGDRFKPLGMGGRRRKLQDFLVDRKVARGERDRLPLVVDRDDRIVWVVGQSVGEDFRVTEPSQAVIFLKARRLGGVG